MLLKRYSGPKIGVESFDFAGRLRARGFHARESKRDASISADSGRNFEAH